MAKKIWTNEIQFSKEEVNRLLQQMEKKSRFTIDRLIYYPYYFLEYGLKEKTLLHGKVGKIGCTIDSISGVGSLIDVSPNLYETEMEGNERIDVHLTQKDAALEGEKFVCKSISYKMKILRMPEVELQKNLLFYRPFWLVRGDRKKKKFLLVFDAVTGKFHPL
ncbi:hypothetical protein SAMN04487936_10589 [Halobacillus dabanensis]|uniref:Uncharacterized protein n=1 Tax=Halobacillus dabanensis TaxID=240302 RepID=A0A1I3V483_HALDA|nr:hypothetical protein [Halobacillus dabanensis]SFJ88997.1 hypothetical protein SAMN04487936_10589 [Halobacillus dabanensis]